MTGSVVIWNTADELFEGRTEFDREGLRSRRPKTYSQVRDAAVLVFGSSMPNGSHMLSDQCFLSIGIQVFIMIGIARYVMEIIKVIAEIRKP